MAIRFTRRASLIPCLRLNASRSGLSLYVGRAWYTTGRRGQRATAGWPGTGLFWAQLLSSSPTRGTGYRITLAIMALFGLAMLVWAIVAASL